MGHAVFEVIRATPEYIFIQDTGHETNRTVTNDAEWVIEELALEYGLRGLPYFGGRKYLGRFMVDAYREKLNRAEANDKAGRLRILTGNMALLEPILREMCTQGKLDFLKEQHNG